MLTIGRLSLTDPEGFTETMGDPIGELGGTPVPATKSPLKQTLSPDTFAPDGQSDTLADRMRLRRQLRSMLNNAPWKLTGLWLAWDQDTEQNGWYVPDRGSLTDATGSQAALAVGYFKLDGVSLSKVGASRTSRRATNVYAKDRRLVTTPRDTLKQVFSTDFAGLSALTITNLPGNVSDAVNAVNGSPATLLPLPRSSQDGATEYMVQGLADTTTVSYEQAETDRLKGDVIVIDRRGDTSNPTTAAYGTGWEEVYGPDYPWATAITGTAPTDTPWLLNGQCRLRYDATNKPGFRIDLWTAGAWTEQGKIIFGRIGDATGVLDGLVSSTLVEYTPDRAILMCVFKTSADSIGRARVYITLQRGWDGPRVEIYPSPKASGAAAGGYVDYAVAAADTNNSVVKVDASSAGAILATAGSGSALFATTLVGASGFTGENWVTILRQGAAFSPTLAVLQTAIAATAFATPASYIYATSRNGIELVGPGLGYFSSHLGFYAQQADQTLEAEAMTLGTGTTSVADGSASGGQTTQATRTTDANPHVSRAAFPSGYSGGKYRFFARVKTSASTLNIYAKLAATVLATKTTTSTSYVWLDLGETAINAGTLEIHAWATAAATISVDRIEAVKVEERGTGSGVGFDGARDLAAEILTDSRSQATLVSR